MKILHTSDLQIDAPFGFLGEKGEDHRKQILATFRRIVELAEKNYQLLLIAGDLFDSNRPSQRAVESVIHQLQRLTIPVCILPGNHDSYGARSVFVRYAFPSNVTIFTDQRKTRKFPELDLAVHGNAVLRKDSPDSGLSGLVPADGVKWNVGMAHGGVVRGDVPDPDRPITSADIARCGMDYLALGDWHGFHDYSQGDVKAFYCGSPEPTAFDHNDSGCVAGVTLSEGGVSVERIRVGAITADSISVDAAGKNESEIIAELAARGDPRLMLDAELSGLIAADTVISAERIEESLAGQFYKIRCRDTTHPELDLLSMKDYPPNHIVAHFLRVARERVESAADETERKRAERALQIGLALLEGREVL